MEAILRPIYQERASDPNTLGILHIQKKDKVSPLTDTFDSILLVVTKEASRPIFTKHYSFDGQKAALHIVTEQQLRKWLTLGKNPKIVDWLLHGRILFDRNEAIVKFRQELDEFPESGRKVRMGIEFASNMES